MRKSWIHGGFQAIARATIECAGVCTSDLGQLTFAKVRRPILPLDRINDSSGGR